LFNTNSSFVGLKPLEHVDWYPFTWATFTHFSCSPNVAPVLDLIKPKRLHNGRRQDHLRPNRTRRIEARLHINCRWRWPFRVFQASTKPRRIAWLTTSCEATIRRKNEHISRGP